MVSTERPKVSLSLLHSQVYTRCFGDQLSLLGTAAHNRLGDPSVLQWEEGISHSLSLSLTLRIWHCVCPSWFSSESLLVLHCLRVLECAGRVHVCVCVCARMFLCPLEDYSCVINLCLSLRYVYMAFDFPLFLKTPTTGLINRFLISLFW